MALRSAIPSALLLLALIVLALLTLALPFARAQAAVLGPGEPLTTSLVEDLLEDALRAAGARAPFGLVVDQPRLPLLNQSPRATEIAVRHPDHDPTNGRFSAFLVGTVGADVRFRLPVHGRLQPMQEVPVLTRALARGERIAAGDLEMRAVRAERLPRAAITDPDAPIGSEARRRLAPGRVLTERDIRAPLLVRRGEPVRLIYVRPGLRLSALGTAQDDGSRGALVRVLNPDSRRRVQGVVTGPDEVTVGDDVRP